MKNVYFLAVMLLSLTSVIILKTFANSSDEKTFVSSDIKCLNFKVDKSNIKIRSTNDRLSRFKTYKKSTCGEIKFSLFNGELNIQSTYPPRGGCHVDYEAFVPAGTRVNIATGKSNVDIENMGELKITAGSLNLNAKNTVSFNLQYASGSVEIHYDQISDYPYLNVIHVADGTAIFHLPAQSTVNIISSGSKPYQSDFTNSLKANFPIVFSAAEGQLIVKKNQN